MWLTIKKFMFLATLMFTSCGLATAASINTDKILDKLGFSHTDRADIMRGEFVTKKPNTTNNRELAAAFAFHVKLSVDEIRNEIKKHPLITTDSRTIEWSPISGSGSLEDFKTLSLAPDKKKRAMAYLSAEPGNTLNLNQKEIATFNAIQVPSGESPVAPVTEAVKRQLFKRFQAYRQAGLSGITPYQRPHSDTSVAVYLRRATETLSMVKATMPDFYRVLINYPKDIPSTLSEEFLWHNYDAHGEPVYILSHYLKMANSGVFVIVKRQFYVSGSYNGGQSISALFPVANGKETVVYHVNRIFTDKLSGLASTLKQSMGNQIMMNRLKNLYQKNRAKAEQRKY